MSPNVHPSGHQSMRHVVPRGQFVSQNINPGGQQFVGQNVNPGGQQFVSQNVNPGGQQFMKHFLFVKFYFALKYGPRNPELSVFSFDPVESELFL